MQEFRRAEEKVHKLNVAGIVTAMALFGLLPIVGAPPAHAGPSVCPRLHKSSERLACEQCWEMEATNPYVSATTCDTYEIVADQENGD
jgi:hypothetical protein